jgi:hypothetical protein
LSFLRAAHCPPEEKSITAQAFKQVMNPFNAKLTTQMSTRARQTSRSKFWLAQKTGEKEEMEVECHEHK